MTGLGRGGAPAPVPVPIDTPRISIRQNHVTYHRGSLIERYTNGESGLEQELQIPAPLSSSPNPQSPTWLELTLTGDLIPRFTDGNQALELTTAAGIPVLRYGSPRATDGAGHPVPTHLALVPAPSPSPPFGDA